MRGNIRELNDAVQLGPPHAVIGVESGVERVDLPFVIIKIAHKLALARQRVRWRKRGGLRGVAQTGKWI